LHLAIRFPVDHVLDMCRTAVNVTGDMITATFVAGSEGNSARGS
jgi:Na+/H+-dicarboxylate symporter